VAREKANSYQFLNTPAPPTQETQHTNTKFDELTKSLAQSVTRRVALKNSAPGSRA
jgi:hypothetical protein